ncbi:MAG: response regulator transcription factor [Pyrinomonadaceae bacterium]
MSKEITIIIADDHPIVRQGFRQIIERKKHLRILAESPDGRDAWKNIEELRPDVAILDVNMPEMNGFEVAQAIRDKNLPTKIVFLTMHDDEEIFNDAVDLGAKGFILKDSALTEITKCIETVNEGRHYVSPSLTGYLINRTNRSSDLLQKKPSLQDLTPAEMRILRLIAQNKKTREIAEELFISYRTVETHRSNICQKLQISGTNALLTFALTNKSELL